jgi:glucose-1-phosphatase
MTDYLCIEIHFIMLFKEIDLQGIKNIIFDLGGVLLHLDLSKTIHAFENLGAKDFHGVYSKNKQSDLFNQMDMGLISNKEFIDGIRNLGHLKGSDVAIEMAWNAMLLNFPQTKYDYLKLLKSKGYRLFLLSNTNSIHEKAFTASFMQFYGHGIEDLFEKTYYSHHLHLRKPNKDIFEFVINDNTLNISETIFIDDTEQHVRGAESVGLRAVWYQ